MPKKKSVQKRTADQATISSFFKPLPADLTKPKIPNKVRSQPSVVAFKETVTKADKRESALPELDENDPQWAMLYQRVGSTEGVGTTMAEHILRWFDRYVRSLKRPLPYSQIFPKEVLNMAQGSDPKD